VFECDFVLPLPLVEFAEQVVRGGLARTTPALPVERQRALQTDEGLRGAPAS
jgi:hypothetical protein